MFDTAATFDFDQLQSRLQSMDDAALKRFGQAAAYMASPGATADGSPPREIFGLQLAEARAEWKRRNVTR